MIFKDGYILIHNPEHHRATTNGYVYEHIVLAENYIGRNLIDGEVVHHEDRNRSNNSKENLFVFKTNEDHSRYHKTGIMIPVGDGSYISPKKSSKCKFCNEVFYYGDKRTGKFCSLECSSKSQRKTERPSKEELKEMIDSMTWVSIGKKYGVSDNAVRKWAKKYELI